MVAAQFALTISENPLVQRDGAVQLPGRFVHASQAIARIQGLRVVTAETPVPVARVCSCKRDGPIEVTCLFIGVGQIVLQGQRAWVVEAEYPPRCRYGSVQVAGGGRRLVPSPRRKRAARFRTVMVAVVSVAESARLASASICGSIRRQAGHEVGYRYSREERRPVAWWPDPARGGCLRDCDACRRVRGSGLRPAPAGAPRSFRCRVECDHAVGG